MAEYCGRGRIWLARLVELSAEVLADRRSVEERWGSSRDRRSAICGPLAQGAAPPSGIVSDGGECVDGESSVAAEARSGRDRPGSAACRAVPIMLCPGSR